MRHTVADKTELPLDALYYVRCMSDHDVMIHSYTGDSFVRADGQPWREDGFMKDGDGFRTAADKLSEPRRRR